MISEKLKISKELMKRTQLLSLWWKNHDRSSEMFRLFLKLDKS